MKIRLLIFTVLALLIASGCEREQELVLPDSTISVLNYDGSPIIQEPNGEVAIDITSQSLAGVDKVEVLVDGVLVETVQPKSDVFTFNYSYTYKVAPNAEMGDKITISFRMIDKDGREVTSVPVVIRIDQPYRIESFISGGNTFQKVTGRINTNFTFTSDQKWLMDSVVSVSEGATLTIEQGTTVYFRTFSNNDRLSRLVILRGAKIIADGTREEPIVFTSDKVLSGNAARGDWGGLSIFGNAATNAGNTVVLGGFRYGGTLNSENSGLLRFVRVEYSGKGGLHSLELSGVGGGTRIEYFQSFESYNNAIRVRGGRVSMKYIAGIQHGGYGIWADEGWQGNGQFWLFHTGIKATLLPLNYWNQARSIELRNDADFFEKQPQTTSKISNVTLIGNGYADGTDFGTRRGVRIRRGAKGFMYNAIITEFPSDAVRVEDLPIESLGVTTIIDNMHSYNNFANWEQEAKDVFFESGNYNLKETPVSGVNRDNFVGTTASPYNPTSMGSWFTNAPFIGAVQAENDWTFGGNWFRNKDGSFRN